MPAFGSVLLRLLLVVALYGAACVEGARQPYPPPRRSPPPRQRPPPPPPPPPFSYEYSDEASASPSPPPPPPPPPPMRSSPPPPPMRSPPPPPRTSAHSPPPRPPPPHSPPPPRSSPPPPPPVQVASLGGGSPSSSSEGFDADLEYHVIYSPPSPPPSPHPPPPPPGPPPPSPSPPAPPTPPPPNSPSPSPPPLPKQPPSPPPPPRTTPLPDDPQTLDIWILAGQSNMVGQNGYDGVPAQGPECNAQDPKRILMYYSSNGKWGTAVSDMNLVAQGCPNCTLDIGPDFAFAHSILSANFSYQVGFVPTAVGSTSLFQDWAPGSGWCYRNMVNWTHAAMTAAGPKARLRGMLWVQGESDATPEAGIMTAMAYSSHFAGYISSVRNEFKQYHPQLPIIMAVMSTTNRYAAFPYIGLIRTAQQAFDGYPGLSTADMEGLEFYTQDAGPAFGGAQWVHLSKKGACQLGQAFVSSYAASGQQLNRPF